MANPKNRLPENAAGDIFVDSSCINCGNCRVLAPDTFGDLGPYAFVKTQPVDEVSRRKSLHALLACPTASIGSVTGGAETVVQDFPMLVEDNVYYCGFNSPKSYGGASYFVQSSDGNWLIDSPRFIPHLVKRFEAMGGLRYIFLTHRDDVADAASYTTHFKAQRIIHEGDRSAVPGAEIVVEGLAPVQIAPDFMVIPVPGHTRGHSVLLHKNKFLFTGDHLEWDSSEGCLGAYQDYCWFDWAEQTRSMERLLNYRFEWVLPGHGDRQKLSPSHMHTELTDLVARMKEA